MVLIKFKALHPDFKLPEQKTEGAAGFDLRYCGERSLELSSVGYALQVPLGFAIEIPSGYEAQIRPRSGLAANNGVTVTNAPGTIDSDYRGEVQALLVKVAGGIKTGSGKKDRTVLENLIINPGDRVCQMVIQKVPKVIIEQVEELTETLRAEAGFGSTGVE
jgi:dUTP pyrophosphatase